MIKQNDNRCLKIIQQVGCFVRSCCAIAEFKTGKELTAEQINHIWEWGIRNGAIKKDNCLQHPVQISNKALKLLGDDKGKFIEIATFTKGKMGYYNSITESDKKLEKFYIQKIKTSHFEGTHFRVIDNEGNLLFDPYEPEVKVESIYYSVVYVYKR